MLTYYEAIEAGVQNFVVPLVWALEADYLAQALMQKQLFPLIREKRAVYLNDYVDLPPLDTYIIAPMFEDKVV